MLHALAFLLLKFKQHKYKTYLKEPTTFSPLFGSGENGNKRFKKIDASLLE